MDPWVLWLIAAVALAIGEIFTLSFFLAPFAGGALAAALVDGVGGGTVVSLITFLAVSAVLLAALRPLARAHRRQPAQLRTGTAALIGRAATVKEVVHADGGTISIDGDVWTARPLDDDESYAPGTRVSVVEIRGATALVCD